MKSKGVAANKERRRYPNMNMLQEGIQDLQVQVAALVRKIDQVDRIESRAISLEFFEANAHRKFKELEELLRTRPTSLPQDAEEDNGLELLKDVVALLKAAQR